MFLLNSGSNRILGGFSHHLESFVKYIFLVNLCSGAEYQI